MSEPTDRERVAWALCKYRSDERCCCETKRTAGACEFMATYADAAIALGAKPPPDPFQTLMGEVMEMWATNCTIAHVTPQDVIAMELVVRHVLDRAKELGL